MSVQNHVTASKNFNVRILAPMANGTDSLRGQVSWSSQTPTSYVMKDCSYIGGGGGGAESLIGGS